MDMGLDVQCIDISKGAVEYMQKVGINARQLDFHSLSNEKYDTILMLMNGIGIAGKLSNLPSFLKHCGSLLEENGRILCDSSDIKYLYEDEDGSLWIDLNTEYYGNFQFEMSYKKEIGAKFDWLYVDFDNLFQAAKEAGLKARKIYDQDDHFLAEITAG